MKSYHAIYENGQLTFQFRMPDCEGPIAVLVVFPDLWDDTDSGDVEDLNFELEDIPN